ncbi:MAG: uracil-DNA glycosylase [Firmicutes bacterium]|nr:uracil-DNA glycosylase [Bacillota bacterium]
MFTLENEWKNKLAGEFNADYYQKLVVTLESEYQANVVYPKKDDVLRALRMVDYPDVRVCILGQDPYYGAGQANGMAFAVQDGCPYPPSLVNIFAELKNDLGVTGVKSGTLLGWAKQGVLLLNTTLTVCENRPQSHLGLGWERFTDAVISALSDAGRPTVFILWGANAIAKTKLIAPRHHIISSPHPSPLSCHRGFFGSKPFSRANAFLTGGGFAAIDWSDVSGSRASYYRTAKNIRLLK